MSSILELMIPAMMLTVAAVITLWIAGAIYLDVCRESAIGVALAIGWVVGVVYLFVAQPSILRSFTILVGLAALFMIGWLQLKPSHDREWDPSVARMPRAHCSPNVITIENVRNFEYRSLTDFTPRYETRSYHLSNLKAADILFIYWGSTWMSHPVLIFDFGADGRVCFSIEARLRKGQEYSVLRSLYRQQELIFVVADERDIILRRTRHGQDQETYLYRLQTNTTDLRTVFLDYVETINSLQAMPRWYHGLCANCTTSFYRLPSSHIRWDWRVIANGRLDRALYENARLDQTLPFKELRRTAYLNDIANRAPETGFGDYIRSELERIRNER